MMGSLHQKIRNMLQRLLTEFKYDIFRDEVSRGELQQIRHMLFLTGQKNKVAQRNSLITIDGVTYYTNYDIENNSLDLVENHIKSIYPGGTPVILDDQVLLILESGEENVYSVTDGTNVFISDINGDLNINGTEYRILTEAGTQVPYLWQKTSSGVHISEYAINVDGYEYLVTYGPRQGQYIFDNGLEVSMS